MQGNELRHLIGTIIFVLGILWLFLSGACTLVFAASFLFSAQWESVGLALTVGVPIMLIGLAIFGLGRYLRSRS